MNHIQRNEQERRNMARKVTHERRRYQRRMADLKAQKVKATRDAKVAFGGLIVALALFLSYAITH